MPSVIFSFIHYHLVLMPVLQLHLDSIELDLLLRLLDSALSATMKACHHLV